MSDKEKETIDKVLSALQSSQEDSHRTYKAQIWELCYKNWRGILQTRIERRSNLFIPITFQTIETMVAKELSTLFGNEKLFEFEATAAEDDYNAEILSKFADYDIRRVPNVYHKLGQFLRMLHIYGTAILRPYWEYDRYKDPKTGELVVRADQFNLKVVPVRNFYVDPKAKTLSEAQWVIEKTVMDKNVFLEKVNMMEFDKIKEKDVDELAEDYESANLSLNETTFYTNTDNLDGLTFDDKREFIQILEYWNQWEGTYCVVAGEKKVVRPEGPIPFIHKKVPYIVSTDIQDPERFYGVATAESIFDLQAELNAMRNHRMDKYNFSMNPMFKAKQGSVFNRKDLIPRLGGMVWMRDTNDLQKIDIGDMKAADYNEVGEVKADIQTTTSISDFSLGQGSSLRLAGGDTATGVSIINSNADARILSKIEYIEQETIVPLGYMWLKLQEQFMKSREYIEVAGQTAVVDRRIITRPYRLKVKASTRLLNKQVRQNQLMVLAQMMLNNPNINQMEFMKEILSAYQLSADRLIQQAPAAMPAPAPGMTSLQAPGGANPMPGQPFQPGQPTGYDFVKGKPI